MPLSANVRGVRCRVRASLGRTQDGGAILHLVEDEDAARRRVPDRQNSAKVGGRGTK